MVGETAEKTNYDELLSTFREITVKEAEKETTHFVPIKLKPKEAKKILRCQRIMLEYARIQYRKALGSEKEDFMRKIYNDAVADYNMFIEQYEKELK